MKSIRIRPAKQKDVSTIDRIIVESQNWKTPRKESIKRAMKNKELLVADLKGELVGFIHYVMHEDIIDGGLNSFITCFYVCVVAAWVKLQSFFHRDYGFFVSALSEGFFCLIEQTVDSVKVQ